MQKITSKVLEKLLERLNMISTGDANPLWDAAGAYHFHRAYGGWQLHKTSTSGNGGVTDVFQEGFLTAREMYLCMYAYLKGYKLHLPSEE